MSRAWPAHRNEQIGCAAGEPFVVEGGVPVDDPVRLFAPRSEEQP